MNPRQSESTKHHGDTVYHKLIVVGDELKGAKTRLLVSFTGGDDPGEYIPTVFDNYTWESDVGGSHYIVSLWDTSHMEDYDRLRPLSYPQTDVALLVYSKSDPKSFKNIRFWYEELMFHIPNAHLVLVGLEAGTDDKKMITTEEGKSLAKALTKESKFPVPFIECDFGNQAQIKNVFQLALQTLLPSPKNEIYNSFENICGKSTLSFWKVNDSREEKENISAPDASIKKSI